MLFLAKFTIGFASIYIINVIAWAIMTKSVKPSIFYLALLYSGTVFIAGMAWKIVSFSATWIISYLGHESIASSVFTFLYFIFGLLALIYIYFIIPEYVLKKYASHLVTEKIMVS